MLTEILHLITQLSILAITVFLTLNIRTLYRMHSVIGFLISELRRANTSITVVSPEKADGWMTAFNAKESDSDKGSLQ